MGEITDFMGRDHRRLDSLFREFQQAKARDPRTAKPAFSEFKARLKKHIAWEEEILFPLFEKQSGMQAGGPTSVMRIEHREIEACLEKIQGRLDRGTADTGEWERRLTEVIASHDQKEEQVLYPWIDESVEAGEKKAAIERMKKS